MLKTAGLENKVEVDSAGLIGYHEGELPDERMRRHARRRGYDLTHLSRPVRDMDFDLFDLIIGMDDSNIDRLLRMAPNVESEQKVHRMTEYCVRMTVDHVPDPYYGGDRGFEHVLDILEDACEGLLREIASLQPSPEGREKASPNPPREGKMKTAPQKV